MATKSTNKKSSSSSSSKSSSSKSSSSRKSTVWSLNKVSFYTLVAVALLYVIGMVFSLVGLPSRAVSALQGVATAIMITIVAILAWRYVDSKQAVWKVLYILCLLLVLVGVIIPLI